MHDNPLRFDATHQLFQKARLARSGVATEQDDLSAAIAAHPAPLGLQECELVGATDKRWFARPGVSGFGRTDRVAHGGGFPDLHRLALAFEHDAPPLTEDHRPARKVHGQPAAENFTRGCHFLQSCSDIHGVSDDGEVAGTTDDRRHHLAGIDPDRKRQIPAELLHRQPRRHCALRVIIVSDRDPEDGHDRVAHVLVDRSPVLCDDFTQPSERGVDHPRHDLVVRSVRERREAHHVGEQDGCKLALLESCRDLFEDEPVVARPVVVMSVGLVGPLII